MRIEGHPHSNTHTHTESNVKEPLSTERILNWHVGLGNPLKNDMKNVRFEHMKLIRSTFSLYDTVDG